MRKTLLYLLTCTLIAVTISCDEIPEDRSGDSVPVEKIELNLDGISTEIIRNRTFQLQVSFYPENATDTAFTWINSNPEVVSISDNGLLTANAEGDAIIGVQLVNGSKRAVARITVTPYIAENPIKTIIFDKTNHDFSDISDAPITITPTFEAVDETKPPTDPYLKWSSSNDFVVQVDQNGKVTIIGGGSAVIRGEAIDGGNAFAECTITVPGTAIKDRQYDSVGPQYADNYYKKVYEQIEIEVPIIDKNGAKTGLTEKQVWLDRNLGASRRATESAPGANDAYKDYLSYGSFFQWSRKADGHEKVIWEGVATDVTPVLTSVSNTQAEDRANVGHSFFIIGTPDWAANTPSGLWGGKQFTISSGAATDSQFANMSYHAPLDDPSQANNPCPYGYRVPSVLEVHQLMLALSGLDKIIINNNGNSVTDVTDKFCANPPYIPFSGNRANTGSGMSLSNNGVWIMIWTNSAQSANNGWPMRVQNTGNNFRVAGQQRGVGYPIRCIKD